MQRLRALGVGLALDDFGTGYSTLARLAFAPANTVKVDRAYVADIDLDGSRRRFLAGLLELANKLDVRTVAEGVKRPAQLHELRAMGCDLVQGNYVGRPLSEADTTALVLAGGPLLAAEQQPGPSMGRAASPA